MYSAQHQLFDTYLDSLSVKNRSMYGEDRAAQIRNIELRHKQLNGRRAVFDTQDIGVDIQRIIHSKDQKAALVVLRQTYKGQSMEKDEGAVMIFEDGLWRLAMIPYDAREDTLVKFQTKSASDVSDEIAEYVDQMKKLRSEHGDLQGGGIVAISSDQAKSP